MFDTHALVCGKRSRAIDRCDSSGFKAIFRVGRRFCQISFSDLIYGGLYTISLNLDSAMKFSL